MQILLDKSGQYLTIEGPFSCECFPTKVGYVFCPQFALKLPCYFVYVLIYLNVPISKYVFSQRGGKSVWSNVLVVFTLYLEGKSV